ncbi:MAG: YncE family protein [Chloroflexota bacterium]
MSAQVAGAARANLRQDPALVAAFLTVVLLAALFLAPRPVPIVEAPALTLAIADLRGQALVIANTGDPSSAQRIPIPGGPHELVALADGRLVASLEQYGALAVVDPTTGDVRELRVGGTPHGLALREGVLYVTDRSADAIRRFTVGSWQELTPLTAGAMPHIVATTDEGAVVIANAADDTLTIGERTVPVSHVPESIAIGERGVVATAGSIGGALQLFDARGASLASYDLGGRPVRLQYDPAGRVLVAALSADGGVAVLERGEVRRIAVGGVPDGLAFSRDGRWLYVSDMYGGAVSVVDLQRSRVVERFAAGRSAGAILVLPR